jgi:phosphoglycerate dehydrogenase-like enzyme
MPQSQNDRRNRNTVGFNTIDLAACKKRNVAVSNCPAASMKQWLNMLLRCTSLLRGGLWICI